MSAFPHYFKPLPAGCTHIDVYRVLSLFEVTDPALQHAVKKLLCAGARGAKDQGQDIAEAIATLQRWQQMREEEAQTLQGRVRFPPMRMILCEICGNKRCPHAQDKGMQCTGSNEPGQVGVPIEQPAPAADPEDAERAAYLARWANAPEWAVELVQFSDGSCRWRSSKSELGLRASFPAGHNLLGSVRCEPRPVQGVGP